MSRVTTADKAHALSQVAFLGAREIFALLQSLESVDD